MNNILSYFDFVGCEDPEVMVYANEINEGTGIRGFFNKRAGRKVAARLSDEIELSKSIMDGIKEGLEELDSSFNSMRKALASNKSSGSKNRETLDKISEIIEKSRKSTWDINQIIDDGEIDYAGFTANVGLATVMYFGSIFYPVKFGVVIHKGYNYFFNIIKNTIRKSLVMLQLNFDQFENLIITKSFQSAGYIEQKSDSEKISEFYGKMISMLFDPQTGMMKNKRGSKEMEKAMELARRNITEMNKLKKSEFQNDNAFNCLDQYNNTYTKSLETLRGYSQDDVQKELESIKNSIIKLSSSNKEEDFQGFGELVIAAAEEHAYKVSTSIYNRFAKMTEVFSLPNQKKLIELIKNTTDEEFAESERKRKEKEDEEMKKIDKEHADKFEEMGSKIFTKTNGVNASLGKLGDDHKYDSSDGSKWDFEHFDELEKDEMETFSSWLAAHPEVLKTCDRTLRVAIHSNFASDEDDYYDYMDSLVDYIDSALITKNVNEGYGGVMSFSQYLLEENEGDDGDEGDEGDDGDDGIGGSSGGGRSSRRSKGGRSAGSSSRSSADADVVEKYFLDLNKCSDYLDEIKKMYVDGGGKVAVAALKTIGRNILKSKSFVKNCDVFVKNIKDAYRLKEHEKEISSSTYTMMKDSIRRIREYISHMSGEDDSENKTKKEG